MAKNGPKGGGRRGAIRGRTQFQLPSGHYAKRDTRTGEIISVKADLKSYKGVVMEKTPPTSPPERTLSPRDNRTVTLQPLRGRPSWYRRSASAQPADDGTIAMPDAVPFTRTHRSQHS